MKALEPRLFEEGPTRDTGWSFLVLHQPIQSSLPISGQPQTIQFNTMQHTYHELLQQNMHRVYIYICYIYITYIYICIYICLTPPAQAADITGLLSYLRPFGTVPLPPFPSKIFAPLSLLRSFPPFPPKAFPPRYLLPKIFSHLSLFFSLFFPKIFSPLCRVISFPPFSPLRPFPPEIFSLFLPKIFPPLSLLRSFQGLFRSSPFSSLRSFPPFPV